MVYGDEEFIQWMAGWIEEDEEREEESHDN